MSASAPAIRRGLSTTEALILFVLAMVQFTHIVDFMIVMPLGPQLLKEMQLSTREFSVVVAAYTVAAGLASFAAANTLDRYSRKAALLTLYAGFGISTFVCALAPNFWCLVAARALAGAFGGVAAAIVFTVIGDVFIYERRGFATGIIMSAFSLASIFGVPMGITLAKSYSWHMPFYALAAMSVPVWVLAAIALPPGRGHIAEATARRPSLRSLAFNPRHIRAFALTVVLVMGTFSVVPYLATYLTLNVGLNSDQLSLMYAIGGGSTLLIMALVGRLSDWFGKLPVYRVTALATVAALVLVTRLPAGLSLPLTLLATTFLMITTSSRAVPATALITAASVPSERGGFLSLNSAVQHMASGLGVTVSGFLVTQPVKDGPLVGYDTAGVMAGSITLLSIVVAGWVRTVPTVLPADELLSADTPDAEVEMSAS
ncbi:MAG: MFS transporter [Gemmataceae bacterium]|nr:MFS transporter [Gemmataceae bacterium]